MPYVIRVYQSGNEVVTTKYFVPSAGKKRAHKHSPTAKPQESVAENYSDAWDSFTKPWKEHNKIPLQCVESTPEREKDNILGYDSETLKAMKKLAKMLNAKEV